MEELLMRIPNHIGVIPDGNRRWAVKHQMEKDQGYEKGLSPGLELYQICKLLGVKELTYYGFTADNTKRPAYQRLSFTKACIDAVDLLAREDAELLVLGNTKSKMFPPALLPYTTRQTFGKGGMKVNFLVNYSWEWDLNFSQKDWSPAIHSADVSRIDLIIRWGGRNRLSGFLPIQSVYSDFYFIPDYWPDFRPSHITEAIEWYTKQDITLGG